MSITIRKATATDVPVMMDLVKVLAEYEKAAHEVINTEEQMLKDGFGEHPLFEAILAEEDETVIGMAIYYYRYSTWKGKRIYLEDIVVKEENRGSGAGKALFEEVISIGKSTACTGMMWQVLDWNESAINFYKKYGTNFSDDWVNCKLNF